MPVVSTAPNHPEPLSSQWSAAPASVPHHLPAAMWRVTRRRVWLLPLCCSCAVAGCAVASPPLCAAVARLAAAPGAACRPRLRLVLRLPPAACAVGAGTSGREGAAVCPRRARLGLGPAAGWPASGGTLPAAGSAAWAGAAVGADVVARGWREGAWVAAGGGAACAAGAAPDGRPSGGDSSCNREEGM